MCGGVPDLLLSGRDADWTHTRPPFDLVNEYEVWLGDGARRVRRAGLDSTHWNPGTLLFTDCNHPLQNALCNEADIRAWRIVSK